MIEKTIIRSHLVPFLFKEFEGKQACYDNRVAKTVVFLPSSSITSYLYTQTNYEKTNKKQDKFVFLLTIDNSFKKKYRGYVYIDKNGVKEPLLMDQKKIIDFNNLIEDMFRVSLTFYIDACLDCGIGVSKAIEKIITKYDLLEVGLDDEAIRGLYYREKKTPNLFRFQSKSANRVVNFA